VEIGGWPSAHFDTLVVDIRKLQAFLDRDRKRRTPQRQRLELYERLFSADDVEEMLGGNATLRRGATLHADVARLVPDASRNEMGASRSYLVRDGTPQSLGSDSAHWRIGRELLAEVRPSPSEDATALLWYRAGSAHLLRTGDLDEALEHLEEARQVFPSSWEVLLDSAYLHQKFSSPMTQAARAALIATGVTTPVGPEQTELERAAGFFRRALALNPVHVEARVRLGRILGQLGRHREAAAELSAALQAGPTGDLLYYAELLLGRAEEGLGRRDSARAHFQNAAALHPRAQSPRLALSQLLRQAGDRRGALDTLQAVTALPATLNGRSDPWWEYYDVHVEDADDLIDELYAVVKQDAP
jgi:tetratricopeptide (TPR) repeat protein